jgi:hypothetical protein
MHGGHSPPYRIGRSLTWDPGKHEVVGDVEANKLLRKDVPQAVGASGV